MLSKFSAVIQNAVDAVSLIIHLSELYVIDTPIII
jgi:hypothetical protein